MVETLAAAALPAPVGAGLDEPEEEDDDDEEPAPEGLGEPADAEGDVAADEPDAVLAVELAPEGFTSTAPLPIGAVAVVEAPPLPDTGGRATAVADEFDDEPPPDEPPPDVPFEELEGRTPLLETDLEAGDPEDGDGEGVRAMGATFLFAIRSCPDELPVLPARLRLGRRDHATPATPSRRRMGTNAGVAACSTRADTPGGGGVGREPDPWSISNHERLSRAQVRVLTSFVHHRGARSARSRSAWASSAWPSCWYARARACRYG